MATNDLEKIIEIFLDKNSTEIFDRDLIEKFDSAEDLIWTIQTLGSGLFQIDFYSKTSFVVRLEPKISLCEDFLLGRCNTKVTSCSKLHACRHLGRCRYPQCRWPHDFSRGINRKLVCQIRCENLNPVLLFRLLNLKRKEKPQNESKLDEKAFVLQTKIDERLGRISNGKFETYVDVLLDSLPKLIIDLSTTTEHFLYVQCDENLDFVRICKVQKNRRQLQGRDVTLKRISEINSVTIEPLNSNVPINRKILDSIECRIHFSKVGQQSQMISIEFLHENALKLWLKNREEIEMKFNVKIRPKIHFVDSNSVNDCQIELPHRFAMVVDHPVFGREFRNFIHSELHIEIELAMNRLRVRSDFHVTSETLSLLEERTKSFMKSFAFRTIQLKQPREQIEILKENSSIVAFYHLDVNRCMLATKSTNIISLMQKVVPKTTTRRQRTRTRREKPVVSQRSITPPPTVKTIQMSLYLQTSAQIALFSDKIIEKHFLDFVQQNHRVETVVNSTTNSHHRLVNITGIQSEIEAAKDTLDKLLSLCRTITYDNTMHYPWIKVQDSIYVIQHVLKLNNIICVCEHQTNPFLVQIHFIHKTHSEFGTDEKELENCCSSKLNFTQALPKNPSHDEWIKIVNEIRARSDYQQAISVTFDKLSIFIFGTCELIEIYRKRVLQLRQNKIDRELLAQRRVAPTPVKRPTPKPAEVKSVSPPPQKPVFTQPAATTQTSTIPPEAAVVNTFLDSCQNSSIPQSMTTNQNPVPRPSTLRPVVQSKPKCSLNFIIDRPGFELLLFNEPSRLSSIIPSDCSLEKQIVSEDVPIEIPLSCATFEKVDEKSKTNTKTGPTENRSFWAKLFGKEKKSTPTPPAQRSTPCTDTSSLHVGQSKILVCLGDLRTQRVDAIVVASTSRYLCEAVTRSAGDFVWSIYQVNASENSGSWECESGNLPCKQIIFRPWTGDRSAPHLLKISIEKFVSSALDFALRKKFSTIAFPSVGCGQLGFDPKLISGYMIDEVHRRLTGNSLTVTFVIEPTQTNVYDAFIQQLKTHKSDFLSFKKQTVKIGLTGPDDQTLKEIQKDIDSLARSCSAEAHLTDTVDLIDWSQETINSYFRFCLQRNVIPTMKIKDGILDLLGPKDGVFEAEKYFYQLTAERLRRSQKTPANSTDTSFPSTWDLTGPTFQRVTLSPSSIEYKNVRTKFDVTMKNLYKKLVSIERIQNRRWFKQYVAHREEYEQRYSSANEQDLFHGCPKLSADKIVQECFNRTFAGVNGVLYGCGVYFHSQASYSHHYARAEVSGERTMFLSKVLVGRTTLGNSTMKTPPNNFDTTTDGKGIFVVYHDASAYAEYLITYI